MNPNPNVNVNSISSISTDLYPQHQQQHYSHAAPLATSRAPYQQYQYPYQQQQHQGQPPQPSPQQPSFAPPNSGLGPSTHNPLLLPSQHQQQQSHLQTHAATSIGVPPPLVVLQSQHEVAPSSMLADPPASLNSSSTSSLPPSEPTSARTSQRSKSTSRSGSGSISDSQHPRVSQRAPKSCTACARRKIRCDKVVPCKSCRDRGEAHLCAREVVVVKGLLRNTGAGAPTGDGTADVSDPSTLPPAPPSSIIGETTIQPQLQQQPPRLPSQLASQSANPNFSVFLPSSSSAPPPSSVHDAPFLHAANAPLPNFAPALVPALRAKQTNDIGQPTTLTPPSQQPLISPPPSATSISYSPSDTSSLAISPSSSQASESYHDFTDAYRVIKVEDVDTDPTQLQHIQQPPQQHTPTQPVQDRTPQDQRSYQPPVTTPAASAPSQQLKIQTLERENTELMTQVAWLQHLVTNLQLSSGSTSTSSPPNGNSIATPSLGARGAANPSPSHNSPFSSSSLSKPNSPEESVHNTDSPITATTAALPALPAMGNGRSISAPISSAATAVNNTYADVLQAITVGIIEGDSDTIPKSKPPASENINELEISINGSTASHQDNPGPNKRAKGAQQCTGSCCSSSSSSGHHHGFNTKNNGFSSFVPALSRKPLDMRDNQLACPSCSIGEMSHCFAARLPFSDESHVSKILYSLAYELPQISHRTSSVLVQHALENLNFMHSAIHPPSFNLEHDYFWSKQGADNPDALFLTPQFDKNRGQYLWLAQWYSVLCLSCFFSDRKLGRAAGLDPKQQQVLPHKLFAAAFECLHRGEVFKYPDIRALQVLAVLGPCFQAFGAINMRNSYLTTSIYIAQRLNIDKLDDEAVMNLHLRSDFADPDSSTRFLDREMGRRIWWATVVADWSDNTGRHSVVHPSSFTTVFPANLDDQDLLNLSEEYSTPDANSPMSSPNGNNILPPHTLAKPIFQYTSVSFQLIQTRLAQIKRYYYANPSQQVLANLELANHELNVLEASMPPILRSQGSGDGSELQHHSEKSINFQRYLIQISIDFERLTINRIMSIYMPQTEWNRSCRAVCLESAHRILAAAAAPVSRVLPFEFKKHPSVTGNGIAAAVYVLLDLLDLSHRQRLQAKSQKTQHQFFDASDGISPPPSQPQRSQPPGPNKHLLDPETIKERLQWVQDFVPVLEQLQAIHPQARRGDGIIRKLITSVLLNRAGLQREMAAATASSKKPTRRKYQIGNKWYNSDNETDDEDEDSYDGNRLKRNMQNGGDDDDDDDDDDEPPTLYEIVQRLSILPQVSAAPSRIRLRQEQEQAQGKPRSSAAATSNPQYPATRPIASAPLPPPNSTAQIGNGFGANTSAPTVAPQSLPPPPAPFTGYAAVGGGTQLSRQSEYAYQAGTSSLFQDPRQYSQQPVFGALPSQPLQSTGIYGNSPQANVPNRQQQQRQQAYGASGYPHSQFPGDFPVPSSYNPQLQQQQQQQRSFASSVSAAPPVSVNRYSNVAGAKPYAAVNASRAPVPKSQPANSNAESLYQQQLPQQQQPSSMPSNFAQGYSQQQLQQLQQQQLLLQQQQRTQPQPQARAQQSAVGMLPLNPTDVTTEDLEIMCTLTNQDWPSSLSNFSGEFDFSLSVLNQPPRDCPDDIEQF